MGDWSGCEDRVNCNLQFMKPVTSIINVSKFFLLIALFSAVVLIVMSAEKKILDNMKKEKIEIGDGK